MSPRIFTALFAIGCTLTASATSAPVTDITGQYANMLQSLTDTTAQTPAAQQHIAQTIDKARQTLALPLIKRADSLDTLRNPQDMRSIRLDPRIGAVEAANAQNGEIFALAMSDIRTAEHLAAELPLLAAAYVLTDEAVFLDRTTDQLRELSTWEPLQRPGWTLYAPGKNLPADGDDGVWLATGYALTAIVQTLRILPADALPADLQASLHLLLERESARILRDWQANRTWYMRRPAPYSNQWILPSSGLVAATAYLGDAADPQARELGIQNLLTSMDSFGDEGAASEGIGYAADVIAPYLYIAADIAAAAGDDRLLVHPFLRQFPLWYMQMFQPGESIVNSFDSGSAARGSYNAFLTSLTTIAAYADEPSLSWFLSTIYPAPFTNVEGLLLIAGQNAQSGQPASEPPALHGLYQRAHAAIWRSSWDSDASGVWVRGGDVQDFHDHWDRGHVNFIAHGQPILIEAGTASYGDPLFDTEYKSVRGHNVLQVGSEIFPQRSPAPIEVIRMDADGGEVVVEAGAGYTAVQGWTRNVTWDAGAMRITDTIELTEPQIITLRWNLGSAMPASISEAESETCAVVCVSVAPGRIHRWDSPEIRLRLSASAQTPFSAQQEQGYNHTLQYGKRDHRHTVIVVRTDEPVTSFQLITEVEAGAEATTEGGAEAPAQ